MPKKKSPKTDNDQPELPLGNAADAPLAESKHGKPAVGGEGTVKSPVSVIFGLHNPWGVAPAGVKLDNTGHHHLLLDTAVPDLKQPIPKDDQHRHFGGGQTETSLALSPGKHTLQLLLGDFAHLPQTPALLSKKITITVK